MKRERIIIVVAASVAITRKIERIIIKKLEEMRFNAREILKMLLSTSSASTSREDSEYGHCKSSMKENIVVKRQ